jgi:hypothetical protein
MIYPQQRRATTLLGQSLLAAVCVLLGMIFIANLAPLPMLRVWTSHVILVPVDAPMSHRYVVEGTHAEWVWRHTYATDLWDSPTHPMPQTLTVTLTEGTSRSKVVSDSFKSPEAIHTWLEANGGASPALEQEAQTLSAVLASPLDVERIQDDVDALWQGTPPHYTGVLYFSGGGRSAGDHGESWYIAAAIVVGLAMYLLILRVLIRRWRCPFAYWPASQPPDTKEG